jgi:hypothetical protein
MAAGRRLQALAGGFALQTLVFAPAFADTAYTGSCVQGGGFSHGSANCVFMERSGPFGIARIYRVEEPRGEELDAAMERDRKWLARCKPVIRQDAYGVGRYYYAASSCEFGRLDDY